MSDQLVVRTVLAQASHFLLGYSATLVPGFLSIYNPHQYEADPLFQPDAVRPVVAVAALAVALMWFFGRKWQVKIVIRCFVAGLALTAATAALLLVAAGIPGARHRPWLLAAELAGTLAMPCVALFTVMISPSPHREVE